MSTPGKGGYIQTVEDVYKTTYIVGETIIIQNTKDFTVLNSMDAGYGIVTITITFPNQTTQTIEYSADSPSIEKVTLLIAGSYRINYNGRNYRDYGNGNIVQGDYNFTYQISVVENQLPLKKWTVTDVINRLLDVCEPIRKGEKPRFRLNAEQAAKYNKILAPQFSFTKQTLRECLQEIGSIVHGEPRLEVKKDENGYYYEVLFDEYGSSESSDIQFMPYSNKGVQHVIESYAGWLDSNAENLINQLDKYSGVIVEPYDGGAKSVRTETQYVRITDENMIIATQYPIYSVEKIEYVYATALPVPRVASVDITPWLFERSVYNSRLSSYAEQYPYSKAYAIYYTQGQKNIEGLNFKVPAAAFAAYKNYAIYNILKQALNVDSFNITDYPLLGFRVTYTPFYDVRVAQTKSYFKDFQRPAALIINQQSNVIESRYYGENLKGNIARLGNIDMSLTYMLNWWSQVPKAGQKFNKDYYIATVAVEQLPTYIRCTIGLSKDFNRLSRFIGVSSVKRYSEVSQTQAVERSALWREFIVIGTQETPSANSYIGQNMLRLIADTFTQTGNYKPLTNVCAWGTSYNGNDVGSAVNLPVISSAFGNSISFTWKYEDNYSAGGISQLVQNAITDGDGTVSGYFQNDLTYTDYYGRIYYYNFDLQAAGPALNLLNLSTLPLELPRGTKPANSSGYISTVGQQPYILRKDNREALQINFQIDFVTNLENIIIGSALSSYCPAVRGSDTTLAAKLYVFPTELNKFTDHVEAWENVDLSTLPSADISVDVQTGYFVVNAANFPASGKSWAIVTAQRSETEDVENEQGEPTTQTMYYGGDLLIGQNLEVTAGQAFTPIYFTVKREIFDRTVWKDRR